MAHQIDESKPVSKSDKIYERSAHYQKTSVTKITDENVVDVLRKALATHELNRRLRLTTCGSITVETSQSEIVSKTFAPKSAIRLPRIVQTKSCPSRLEYLCGEPIQYVSRNGGEEIVKQINTLNSICLQRTKPLKTKELVEWQMICGTAFRLVLPDEPGEEDEAPFELLHSRPERYLRCVFKRNR